MYWCMYTSSQARHASAATLDAFFFPGTIAAADAGCDKKYACTDGNVHLLPSCRDGKIGHTTCPEANINNN